MPRQSKRYLQAQQGVDPEKLYSLEDAFKQVKDAPMAKFDETVDIAINLGVDPKHADQLIRGAIVLPNESISLEKTRELANDAVTN